MKLKKDTYQISRATLEKVLAVLNANHASMGLDEDEHNNDDIIEAQEQLEAELSKQN